MGFENQLEESTGPEVLSEQAQSNLPADPPVLLSQPEVATANGVAHSTSQVAVPPLQEWLDQLVNGDFQTRWDVSKMLNQYPLEVLEPLLALLPQAGEDEELLWFLARLFGEIDHPEAVETLAEILRSATTTEMQSVAALALANRGESALPALEALLLQPEMRLLAVQVLAQIDAQNEASGVVTLLLGIVEDEDAAVRAAAIDALGGFANPAIAPALLAALQDCDSGVRRLAVRAVGARAAHLPGVALDEAIAPLLQDLNPQVVEQAIVALGRLDTAVAHQGLIALLVEDHWPLVLQLQAVRALGWSQCPEAIERLLAQLERCLVESAESECSQPNAPTVPLPLAREIIVVLGRLRAPQPVGQAAQALERCLPAIFAQADADLKRSVALALGQLGLASSFEALCPYLQDPSPGLSFHIVAALRRLDSVGGVARLQRLAETQSGLAQESLLQAISEWS